MRHDHRIPRIQVLRSALSNSELVHEGRRIPCYGLPEDWSGSRCLGESHWEHGYGRELGPSGEESSWEDHWETVQLYHGDCRHTTAPWLRVETSNVPDGDLRPLSRELIDFGGGRADMSGTLEVNIAVDGVLLSFSSLANGTFVVGRHPLGAHTITFSARAWPMANLELVTVRDLAPYYEERRKQVMLGAPPS